MNCYNIYNTETLGSHLEVKGYVKCYYGLFLATQSSTRFARDEAEAVRPLDEVHLVQRSAQPRTAESFVGSSPCPATVTQKRQPGDMNWGPMDIFGSGSVFSDSDFEFSSEIYPKHSKG